MDLFQNFSYHALVKKCQTIRNIKPISSSKNCKNSLCGWLKKPRQQRFYRLNLGFTLPIRRRCFSKFSTQCFCRTITKTWITQVVSNWKNSLKGGSTARTKTADLLFKFSTIPSKKNDNLLQSFPYHALLIFSQKLEWVSRYSTAEIHCWIIARPCNGEGTHPCPHPCGYCGTRRLSLATNAIRFHQNE